MGPMADALHRYDDRPTRVRYVVVAVATLMSFLLYLDRFCLSFVEGIIGKELGLKQGERDWLLGVFFLTYALGQVPSGWLSDRFGPRRMLALYILGWSLFTGLLGAGMSFPLLLAARLGCGLAQAGAYPTSANLLSKWVPLAHRGFASGLVTTGGRLGGAVASGLTAWLMVVFIGQGLGDWRLVMAVYAVAGVLVAGVYWTYFRDRPEEHPDCNGAEVELIAAGREEGGTKRAGALPLTALVGSLSLTLSSISQFCTNFGWVFLLTLLPRYLEKVHQLPEVERGVLAGVPTLAGMFGMFGGGWLVDFLTRHLGLRWGRCLPMALTRFSAMAAYLLCPFLDGPYAVIVALSLVAISVDLGTPAVWAFKQDIGGRYVGSVLGWGNMWGNIGAFVSPIVLGLIERDYGWNGLFLACAAVFGLAGLVTLGVDATKPIPVAPEDEDVDSPGDRAANEPPRP